MPTVSRKRALPLPDPATLVPPVLACPGALAPFLRRAPVPVLVRSCLEWLVEEVKGAGVGLIGIYSTLAPLAPYLAVRKLRLFHAELSLNEKVLLLITSIGRGDYRGSKCFSFKSCCFAFFMFCKSEYLCRPLAIFSFVTDIPTMGPRCPMPTWIRVAIHCYRRCRFGLYTRFVIDNNIVSCHRA